MRSLLRKSICLIIFCFVVAANAKVEDPWLMGPLFENHPVSYTPGHGFFDYMVGSMQNNGFYDTHNNIVGAPRTSINTYLVDMGYGVSKESDVRLTLPFIRNLVSGHSFNHIGDALVVLGYQVWRQKNSHWLPDFRVTLEEIFPTGTWDGLNPNDNGADSTGTGSFQTALGMRFRKIIPLRDERFLALHARFRLNYPSSVPIRGFSIYGGSRTTDGKIYPGNSFDFSMATEYKFTQNWGIIMEVMGLTQGPARFSGSVNESGTDESLPKFEFSGPGLGLIGSRAQRLFRRQLGRYIVFNNLMPSPLNLGKNDIGNGNHLSFSLAPAIEYNFTKDFGIVGGPYFNVLGKNTPSFLSAVVILAKSW